LNLKLRGDFIIPPAKKVLAAGGIITSP